MLYIFGLIIIIGIGLVILDNLGEEWWGNNHYWEAGREGFKKDHPIKFWIGKHSDGWIKCLVLALIIVFSISLIGCAIGGIYEEAAKETTKQEYLAQYTILQYQIDNQIIENYVEYESTQTTYVDAIEYNQAIIRGRQYHDTFWLGWCYSNIYDDLPLIELPNTNK